jgi:hypothetical protein
MLRCINSLVPYQIFMKPSINLNRWTVGASIENLIEVKGFATRVRAPLSGRAESGKGMGYIEHTYEWSHQCLEHWSLHMVLIVPYFCACCSAVYYYYE